MGGRGENKTIHVVGVPLDHGAGRRGVGMGPSALRIARLHEALARVGCRLVDQGDIEVPIPETLTFDDPTAKYLPLVSSVCRQVAAEVREILDGGGFPLVIGGDHSIAIGTISGIAAHLRARSPTRTPQLGVLWFDAHGDLNTPQSSPSGNIHGMSVACLLGKGPRLLTDVEYPGPKLQPDKVVQIGLRDLDESEKALLRESGIHAYTMADIDKLGMAGVMEEALGFVTDGTDAVHIDFDIDVLDPQVAPGTGTRKIGGISYREAHLALEMVAERTKIGSMELVEVNPILDEQNKTAELAVGLIASALGATIL